MVRVGFLGLGSWGFCLATLLAEKGFEVKGWSHNLDLIRLLSQGHPHPHLPGHYLPPRLQLFSQLEECLKDIDILIESVTSAGIRPVFERVYSLQQLKIPIILTSKGIEQNTGLILPEVLLEVFGEGSINQIGCLSGPSFAEDVIKGLPTSVVGSAFHPDTIKTVCQTFTNETFRVYPNADIYGVCMGGALKNVIAIACGISEGLGLGSSARAALMTRGLHEIRKLAIACGCKPETLNGLSGMGDLCLTCGSLTSRNYRFGYMLAKGTKPKEAEKQIGMVVEGAYTCTATLQLSHQHSIPMPITEIIYQIIYESLNPQQAVQLLMQRTIKDEHL